MTRPASFGPIFVVPIAYFNIRIYIFNKTLVSNQKYDEKIKKYSHRAQATLDASFGPVFVVPALPVAYFVRRVYILNKTLVTI